MAVAALTRRGAAREGVREGGSTEEGPERGTDLEYQVNVGFWDAIRGAVMRLNITRLDTCTNCHGSNAVSAGNAPDLRASAIPLSAEAFARVVRDGALLDKGMPRFEEFDDQKLNAIRQFIRSRSADLRAGR